MNWLEVITKDGKRFKLECPSDTTAQDLTEVSERLLKMSDDAKKSALLFP